MEDRPKAPVAGHRKTGGVTIKTVAKSLGLSPSTVSRALRGDPSVTERTTRRIRKAAEELGYTRDVRGVNLRTGQTNTICALLMARPKDEYGDPSVMQLIKGIIAGVSGTDKTVVFRLFSSLDEQLYALHELVASRRFDGFILDHTLPQDPRAKYLLEHDFPFVSFGRTELFSPHAYFDVDNEFAAYQAVRQLLGQGRKRIALITPPSHNLFVAHWRRGYRRALEESGIPVDLQLIAETGMETRSVEHAVERLCSLDEKPDAFVCPNEVTTIAVIRSCERAGLDIEKTAFFSRDGTRFFDYFRPAVSSCYFPSYEVGEELSRLMLRVLDGDPVESLQRLVKTELILR